MKFFFRLFLREGSEEVTENAGRFLLACIPPLVNRYLFTHWIPKHQAASWVLKIQMKCDRVHAFTQGIVKENIMEDR